MSQDWKLAFLWTGVANCGAVIWFMLLYGHPENQIHVKAMDWAWWSGLILLMGAGVLAASDSAISLIAGIKGILPNAGTKQS